MGRPLGRCLPAEFESGDNLNSSHVFTAIQKHFSAHRFQSFFFPIFASPFHFSFLHLHHSSFIHSFLDIICLHSFHSFIILHTCRFHSFLHILSSSTSFFVHSFLDIISLPFTHSSFFILTDVTHFLSPFFISIIFHLLILGYHQPPLFLFIHHSSLLQL